MSIRKRKYAHEDTFDNIDTWALHLHYCVELPASLIKIVLEYWQPCMCDTTYWPKEEEWEFDVGISYDYHFDHCVYFQDPGDVCVWCHRIKMTDAHSPSCVHAHPFRALQHYSAS